jgi:carbamoyltransferase
MNILGINYFFHDSSVCILKDGELVAAIEEERLNRKKHTTEFPRLAVERCLAIAGLSPGDVDHIALSIRPLLNWDRKLKYAADNPRAGFGFLRYEISKLERRQRSFARWLLETFSPAKLPKIHFVEHHLAHVAGSFLCSPYEEAALLGLDGSGEWATSFLGVGRGTNVSCFNQSFFPMSLGSFYEAVTEFCGFRPNYDEGKTMGLAPYGDPEPFRSVVSDMVRIDDDGGIHVDLSYFTYQFHGAERCGPKFFEAFGAPRRHGEPFADRHENAAAAFQRVLEERALEICRVLHARAKCRHLVISGGVALNSVMNGRIVRETPFDDVYVMPGAGDNGTCIGAAYYVHNVVLHRPRTSVHMDPYVGTSYEDADYARALEAHGLPVRRQAHIESAAADLLHRGKILGWFQGKMEFGPRALGNRSILANPTLPDMKAVLNARVKHREPYRPFAPSVIAEKKGEYFETEVDAPFMLKVCDVRPSYRDKLPAITHVDGSARIQTVHQSTNARYHRLIQQLGERTGTSVVLNTSFNVMGQPIVETPEQAVECFLGTGIEALVLGDYLVEKEAD